MSNRRVQQNAPPPYPLMNIDEIVNCLHALGIGANPEDLVKPNPQTAQAIYAGMLDALMGAPTEMLEQPRQALMGMMEYKVGRFQAITRHQIAEPSRTCTRMLCSSPCSTSTCTCNKAVCLILRADDQKASPCGDVRCRGLLHVGSEPARDEADAEGAERVHELRQVQVSLIPTLRCQNADPAPRDERLPFRDQLQAKLQDSRDT